MLLFIGSWHCFFCFAKILNETKSLSLRNPTPSLELSFSQIWLFLEQINSPFQPSVVVSRSQSARNVCTTSLMHKREKKKYESKISQVCENDDSRWKVLALGYC